VSDDRRARVQGCDGLRTRAALHRWSMLREPGAVSVLGDRRLRKRRALHERKVLSERRRSAVLGAWRLRITRALHGRRLLCEHDRLAVLRRAGVRPVVVVRERHLQLTPRENQRVERDELDDAVLR
jgi:hypothetical protein